MIFWLLTVSLDNLVFTIIIVNNKLLTIKPLLLLFTTFLGIFVYVFFFFISTHLFNSAQAVNVIISLNVEQASKHLSQIITVSEKLYPKNSKFLRLNTQQFFHFWMSYISFNIACKELKIVQTSQLDLYFELLMIIFLVNWALIEVNLYVNGQKCNWMAPAKIA